jgi:hypothetical protein
MSSVEASPKGIEAAGGALPWPSRAAELFEWWRQALPTSPARIFDQLYRQDGKWIDEQRLDGFLGLKPTGGSWNTAIAMLRQNSLIEINGRLRLSLAIGEGGSM